MERQPDGYIPDEALEQAWEYAFRDREGEPLSREEREAWDKLLAQYPHLLEALAKLEDRLDQSSLLSQPSATFSKEVMGRIAGTRVSSSLSSSPNPSIQPTPPSPHGLRVFSAPARLPWFCSPIRIALTAALLLAALGLVMVFRPGFPPSPFRLNASFGPLTAPDGQPATRIKAGETYHVTGPQGALLHCGKDGWVRFGQGARFQTGPSFREAALQIQEGTVFAYRPSTESWMLECLAFQTRMDGLSMIFQKGHSGSFDHPEPLGLAMVLKGKMEIALPGQPQRMTLGEGDVYLTGFGPGPIQEFIENAGIWEQKLDSWAQDPQANMEKRPLYVQAVEGYRKDLEALEREGRGSMDQECRTEWAARKAQVERYLQIHQSVLRLFPNPEAGADLKRAFIEKKEWLRLAVDKVKEGRREAGEKGSWM